MISFENAASGKLLISEPFMSDPNFKRSVVYLAEHNIRGTVGFVLNQKSGFLLSDLIDEFENNEYQVYTGGPVGSDKLHFVHTLGHEIYDAVEVSKGVYWGGSFESLKVVFEKRQVLENEIKFFLGYSGWGTGQLELEIKQNAWIVSDSKSEFIFADIEKQLWNETVISLGEKFAPLVNFPENPSLN